MQNRHLTGEEMKPKTIGELVEVKSGVPWFKDLSLAVT